MDISFIYTLIERFRVTFLISAVGANVDQILKILGVKYRLLKCYYIMNKSFKEMKMKSS